MRDLIDETRGHLGLATMNNPSSSILAFVLVLASCTRPDQGRDPAFSELAQPSATAPLLGLPAPSASLKARMRDHTTLSVQMRDAVVRADLPAVKSAAKQLAQIPVDSVVDLALREKLATMTSAAKQVAEATSPNDAAFKIASLGIACGACHTVSGGPHPAESQTPEADASAVLPRMARHKWAVAQMWEGLVAPSDAAWLRGASVLAEAPLLPDTLTPGKTPVPKVGELATAVHEIARKAIAAESAARGELYGELLDTCASCHGWLGGPTEPSAR